MIQTDLSQEMTNNLSRHLFTSRRMPHLFLIIVLSFLGCEADKETTELRKDDSIVIIGNNLASRMMNYGYFETELHLRYPDSLLTIRNMADGGNTPSFRPHSGRNSPWAFPGGEEFHDELATNSGSIGHFETPDEWLTKLDADVVLAFFGSVSSYNGPKGLASFKSELDAFVQHTLSQKYNGSSSPRLVLVSPIAFEDLSEKQDLPDGVDENVRLSLYTEAMRELALERAIHFVDAFNPSKKWFAGSDDLTLDGLQLTDQGYRKFSDFLADEVFGKDKADTSNRDLVHGGVTEKNWIWHNDYKIPNGVHVFGRRYDPFGPDNYPSELKKLQEMTIIRDRAIWMAGKGEVLDLAAEDIKTTVLPPVDTNYKPSNSDEDLSYLYGQEALDEIQVAEGYKIELFASEKEFPDLANPVQMSFDNKGRLWVAVMPSYPHYKPGDHKPDDKLLILEDTDGDNKADKQTIFADGLHLPIGFEFAPEGVYVSQGTNLVLLKDNDGDDHYDEKEILLSGFDDHDTHHAISAFAADPSGAIFMGEGVFLHTNVETAYGPVRATNGGFYRYNPQRRHLERNAQLSIPNPWGIAFDEWGQNIFAETSGPAVRWMLPGSVKSRYGVATHKSKDLIEPEHRVRPTSGLEFVSSRHFPDEVQGDLIINNTIGFLGTKLHQMIDDGTGFQTKHRLDLVKATDKNFRPVDMEFAPDGSLYLVDWHNILIGHMQHNARDPLRDHVHGRIYRITYPSRPLVEPAKIVDASVEELLQNLTLPEFRTRYRTRRELRDRDHAEVKNKLKGFVDGLDSNASRYEHHLLEALWLTWALNDVDQDLLRSALEAKDFRVRSAATRVLRYMHHQVDDSDELFLKAAQDEHGRVRLEAIVAASWLQKEIGVAVLNEASIYSSQENATTLSPQATMPLDEWTVNAHITALAHLNGESAAIRPEKLPETDLKGADFAAFKKGKEIYDREGYCITCHQADGNGLKASGFPPLSDTKWVLGHEERLIRLTLKGVYGPMEVRGDRYPGQVPMTPFEGLLEDDELAAVLTFVRNSFGNKVSPISSETVKRVRQDIAEKKGFYTAEELLIDFPHPSN